jgi:hypothetical protein
LVNSNWKYVVVDEKEKAKKLLNHSNLFSLGTRNLFSKVERNMVGVVDVLQGTAQR